MSRCEHTTRLGARAAALAAAVVVLTSCADLAAGPGSSVTTVSASPTATNPPGTAARLVRVLDGDSLEVDVDGNELEVRIIGINAPEADECHGDAARDGLRRLTADRELVLVSPGDAEDTDRFGRALRFIWTDGADVGASQIARGNAVVLQSGHREESRYLDLLDDAIDDGAGMWGPACGPAVSAAVTILPPTYDPPGRDSDNALREFVDIRNDGDDSIDMTGWIVRDESSQHRYVFDGVVLAPGDTLRLRSGCGDDRGLDLAWCADDAVWSNGGDTVIVQDRSGNVVAVHVYRGDF